MRTYGLAYWSLICKAITLQNCCVGLKRTSRLNNIMKRK
jgi:hypothetical protein